MSNSIRNQRFLGPILSLIPIGFVLGLLFGILNPQSIQIDNLRLVFIMLGTGTLYGVAVYLAQSIHSTKWLGYLHVATTISLLTLGITYTLFTIIFASLIAVTIYYIVNQNIRETYYPIREITGWISISGITVIIEYILYSHLLNQSLPFNEITVQSLVMVIFSLSIGNAISIFVGSIITSQAVLKTVQQTIEYHSIPYELLLLFVAVIISIVPYQINILTFLIILSFTIAQALHENRTQKLKQQSDIRLQELVTLNNVAQAVSVDLSLDSVLKSIYDEVNQLVDATSIYIALYNAEHNQITYPLAMTKDQPVILPQQTLDDGLMGYVIRNKQSLHLYKYETQRIKKLGIQPDKMKSQCYIGIPIMIGEEILGVMEIINKDHPNILGSTSIETIQAIVNQASLVLRNATLYERTTQLASNLSLINQSVGDVMFNLDQNEALQAAAKTALTVTNAKQAAIFLIDTKDVPKIRLAQSIGMSPAFVNKFDNTPSDWFNTNATNYRIVHNVKKTTDTVIQDWANSGHFKAMAEIPMRSGNTVMGYLTVFHEQIHHYHKLEIDLLEMLANQITVALDNADLLQALELYASEQAELVHLSNISAASLELEQVLTNVCFQLAKMLKVNRVEIGLYVVGQDHFQTYTPSNSGYLDVEEYPLSQYPEFQINKKKNIRYPQILLQSDTGISDTLRQYMEQREYEMMTISPMVINSEVIGVILICDTQRRIFKDNERRLIEMATTQIAVQIHNTQIHTLTEEALVQRLEQLSLIEDIGQKISRSLDLDLIINNVLEAALRSTQADIALIALVEDNNTVSIKFHKPDSDDTQMQTTELPIDIGVIGQIIKNGVMRVIADNRKVREYISPPDNAEYLSSLAVPLIKGDTVIGVLNVESSRLNFFTDEHTGFIKSLAGHAVISIDNANLLYEHQKQIQILSQLRELALSASTTTSTDSIIQTIIQTASDMLNGTGGILIPYDTEHREFDTTSTLGWIRLRDNFVQDMFFIPKALLYQVSHTEEVLIIEDVYTHDRYKTYEQLEQVVYKSIVIIPIKRRNQVTELLCVTFKNRRKFNNQDQNTIQLLQVQVANHLENVKLSEEIRGSNVRMRAILDSTRDGIILLDRDGKLQDANASAEDLLSIDLSNFHNQPFTTILINHNYSSTQRESFADLLETARILQNEPERNMIREYTLKSGGKTLHIREASSPVWDSSNRIMGRLLSLRDVTDERTMEEFRTRLQSMIVHDLKSPLSAIITSMMLGSDLLSEIEESDITDDLRQLMQVAQETASSQLELVESMLDIGKLQKQEMTIDSSDHAIKDIAEAAYTSLLGSFRQANIKMKYDIADDIDKIFVDEGLIRRVFINLIQNAIKFTPVGGEIRVTARLSQDRKDMAEIMISDTGPGIPMEHRERIFGEFTTIDDKTQKQQRGPRGQGLGLTFCKLAIEAHNGAIWIADEGPLSGATFVFTLPLAT